MIPTTAEINAGIIASLETALAQTVPWLPRTFCRVLSKALSGPLSLVYKYAGFIFLQQFVQFASTKPLTINGKIVIPLVEWGRLVGIGDPTEATRWEGVLDVTVLEQIGSLPVNTLLTRVSTGVTYLTLSAVTLDAAVVQVSVRAYGDQDNNGGRGTIGNLSVGDIVSFVNPIPNVKSDAVVASVTTTAADAESWDIYRQRVIDRFRQQPQGGAPVDYEGWGEELEGIVNVYPYHGDPGQVDVYSEATPESSGSPDGIPTAAQLLAVKAIIELDSGGLATRRPVNAWVNSYPISRTSFDVDIIGLDVADETAVLDRIESALSQYFLSREPYIAGVSLGRRKDRISNAAILGVVQDVVNAYNGVFTSAVLKYTVGGGTVILHSLQEGEKAKVTNVTSI